MLRKVVGLSVLALGLFGCGSDADHGVDGLLEGWAPLAAMPGPMQETAVAALGEQVYVVGGLSADEGVVANVDVYDPAKDAWSSAPDLPKGLHHANLVAVGDSLYVVGSLVGLDFQAVGDVYVWKPGDAAWTSRQSMPVGSERGASVAGVIDGKIYVAGGFRAGASVADASVYDPGLDAWAPLPALPEARDHLAGGVVGGRFFAIGGRANGTAARRAQVDIFDPALPAAWSSGTPMPTARSGCAYAVVDGRIFVFGGEGNPDVANGVFPQSEAYAAVSDTWESLASMPTPRHGMGAAAVDGTIYVPGGAIQEGFGATAVHESFTP